MKTEEILSIVEKVVSKQLRDTTVQTERDELRNVAVVGVLEAAKKGGLTPEKVGVIAKREIINFKLGSWGNANVPKGSRNYLRKKGRLTADETLDEEKYGKNRRHADRLKVLRIAIKKWKQEKHGYERLLIEKLMDGLTTHQVWHEILEDYGRCGGLDAMYDLLRSVASELRRLLQIPKDF